MSLPLVRWRVLGIRASLLPLERQSGRATRCHLNGHRHSIRAERAVHYTLTATRDGIRLSTRTLAPFCIGFQLKMLAAPAGRRSDE